MDEYRIDPLLGGLEYQALYSLQARSTDFCRLQLSGLGANGSFELSDVFVPTPRVLSGEDASSGDEEDNSSDEEPIYVPKATKSRSSPQKKPTNKQEPTRKPPGSAKKGVAVKKGTPAKKGPVAKGRGRPSGKVSKKGRKLKVKEESEDEESDVEMEVQAEYTPRKSQSRGGPARTTPSAKKPGPKSKKSKKVSKSTAPRQPRQRSVTPSDNEADDDEEPEYTPQKTKSRGRLSDEYRIDPLLGGLEYQALYSLQARSTDFCRLNPGPSPSQNNDDVMMWNSVLKRPNEDSIPREGLGLALGPTFAFLAFVSSSAREEKMEALSSSVFRRLVGWLSWFNIQQQNYIGYIVDEPQDGRLTILCAATHETGPGVTIILTPTQPVGNATARIRTRDLLRRKPMFYPWTTAAL
ncbi:hypothetical protein EGW08_005814 [Elysia chlorotica]|uniref:Uncharacterized protein n=1 Tax=Elysia chlorotica TaxID=188477 RepID=A0A433TXY8_ELYCH|nr:hypothetical protein EGW08_005814 [Elysia chlorotica]